MGHSLRTSAGVFLALAAFVTGARAQVPDPGQGLILCPDAAKAGPPAWAKPGTRLVYFGMSASVRAVGQQLVLDDHGNWVNKDTGQRLGVQEVPTASGAGYSVFQIGYVDQNVAEVNCQLYLLDTTNNSVTFTSSSGLVTNAGCGGDMWIHPDALKNLKEVNEGGVRIMRMPYTLNNKQYKAIRVQTTTGNGYTAYVYDLETGIMIFHGASAQGAGVLTPGPNGQAGVGAGNTQLVTGWIMEVKDVDVPWKAAAIPAWVGKFRQLNYQGALSTAIPNAGQMDLPVTSVVVPKAHGDGWLRFGLASEVRPIAAGMPPSQQQMEGASGPASVGGLWIGPDAIPKLRQNQVIDKNDITKTTTVVSDVGPRGVVISEIGALHRIDWAYDAASGMLAAIDVTTQNGVARTKTHQQLSGQK